MATIKDIAAKAGVSPTTVSNVLHGRTSKVSPEIYKKVQQVLKECNYVSNMAGRLLSNHGSKIIGVIINYERHGENTVVESPFYSEIIGTLEQAIRNSGYFMMLHTSSNAKEWLQMAKAWDIEGLIFVSPPAADWDAIRTSADIPFVLIDGVPSQEHLYTNIGLQDKEGAYQMTSYLISQGHQNIAFLADQETPVGVDDYRLAGFQQALSEHHIACDSHSYIHLDYDKTSRHKFLKNFCQSDIHNYSALFFASDFYAIDAVNIFYDCGLRVPDDISVAGFDNNIFAEQCRPGLTTINQSISLKAETAWKYLQTNIEYPDAACQNIKLPVELVVRKSVKKLK